MVTQVDLSVHHSKVEVVAGAEISDRHDEVVSAFSHHNPDNAVARFEYVFFYAVAFNRFPGFGETLAENGGEFSKVRGVNPVFSRQDSANSLQRLKLGRCCQVLLARSVSTVVA